MELTGSKTKLNIVLHAYQPINQYPEVLERIVNNCYIPFLRSLNNFPEVKISLNVSGILIEKLVQLYPTVISLIRENIQNNQLELLGSAYYHPILPFLDKQDQVFQITKQSDLIKKTFNQTPSIFFPPELALNYKVIYNLHELNYKGVIAPANIINLIGKNYFQLADLPNIRICKRNKVISNNISFNHYHLDIKKARNDLRKIYLKHKKPVLLAMDLETYGEHIPNYHDFFFNLVSLAKTDFVSNQIREIEPEIVPQKNLFPSSWSTSLADQTEQNFYPLWDHPKNAIHQLQHCHIELLKQIKIRYGTERHREIFNKANYSCQFWWASGNFFSRDLILKGFQLQKKALEEILNEIPEKDKEFIVNLSNNIERRLKVSIQSGEI